MVYPLINNYKAQRNVRAELGGAVDLGEPVSLYIKEDEVKYSSKNLATNGKFQDGTVTPFTTGTGSVQMDVVELATNPVSGRTSLRLLVGDANDVAQGDFNVSVGKTYKFSFNRTIPNHTTDSKCKFRLGIPGDVDAYADLISFTSNTTTGVFRESFMFTAIDSTLEFRINESGTANDAEIFIDDIQLHEVVDHTYKLMAVNDTIPSQSVNVDAVSATMVTNGDCEADVPSVNGVTRSLSDSASFATSTDFNNGGSKSGKVTADSSSSNPQVYWSDGSNMGLISGRPYYISVDVYIPDTNQEMDIITLRVVGGSGSILVNEVTTVDAAVGSWVTLGGPTDGLFTDNDINYFQIIGNKNGGGAVDDEVFYIDNLVIKEVYGYDYYNAPAYKFGIVSSVYDQSTGAMKTSGVAGDEVDVTVQGECTVRSASQSKTQNHLIGRISNSGAIANYAKSDDTVLPNSVGVMVETTTSATSHPIILWQGVEFSEHFVHKNSLQVMAKCDETITKFRPVSLFLDSEGDLLCRHDKIPAELPDANTDHTGVDPGKWGVAELGGVSGDIIPVTVAGKTHVNTPSTCTAGKIIRQVLEGGNIYSTAPGASSIPGGIGTLMENGTGDVPITIFQGTPIGTITDWKRTIKVTAKANGAITQYCPVSLYLDQYGEYKCISDTIPNKTTEFDNGRWVDFRKWGVAQETVADGENVEIIVQGRTNVVDAKSSSDKGEFVRRISSDGISTSNDNTGHALSCIGIVEKESKTSQGTPGVIIIF